MYEWLAEELEQIRTRRFHVVDGPASESVRQELLATPLPASYRAFLLRFGGAKLYREGQAYAVGVVACAEAATGSEAERLKRIGHFEEANAYFKADEMTGAEEAPVFEWSSGGLRRAADTFHEWIQKRCGEARRRYGKKRWREILRGPLPFTEGEEAIVSARRQYRWTLLGVSVTGALRFKVENASEMRLPYLSVGIRSKDGRIEGGVWLPTRHIAPGENAVIEKECYRGLIEPSNLDAFPLPDPTPEDRERYWEFR